MARSTTRSASRAAAAGGIVLMTLAAGQFVMALDTTVMNTAIATVADDLGTTVTGIQTAITMYTLVMASFMITGGKIGEIVGRKKEIIVTAGGKNVAPAVLEDRLRAHPLISQVPVPALDPRELPSHERSAAVDEPTASMGRLISLA